MRRPLQYHAVCAALLLLEAGIPQPAFRVRNSHPFTTWSHSAPPLAAGLTLEAARWDAEAGCLADSLPGQLRQVRWCCLALVSHITRRSRREMEGCATESAAQQCCFTSYVCWSCRSRAPTSQALPVLHIRPVTSEAYAEAVAAGNLYLCPVYVNGQRANVYSSIVSTFALRTAEPPAKWTLRSAALLLQDETAA